MTQLILKCQICDEERKSLPDSVKYDVVETKSYICSECKHAIRFVKENMYALRRVTGRESATIDREAWQ